MFFGFHLRQVLSSRSLGSLFRRQDGGALQLVAFPAGSESQGTPA